MVKQLIKDNYSLLLGLFFLVLVISGLSFWLGYLNGYAADAELNGQASERHEKGYRFISPLLECQAPASFSSQLSRLGDDLEKTVKTAINSDLVSHVSVYLRDLNNGPWVGINQNEKFSPASLMKVPIMISYLKAAELNPDLLKKKITVTMDQDDTLSQNIRPAEMVVTGEEYSVEELIRRMIRYSDNLAANTLLQHADIGLLDKTYYDLGVNVPNSGDENFLTVREYASFFRILYNSSYLSRQMSELALQILSTTEYSDGIVSGVPSYITVAHKFGERRYEDTLQLHDCGIVYRSDSPYLLCIMTRGDDFQKMKSVIHNLSEQAFQVYQVRK